MKKVRIGVIGAGWWATFAHIPAVCSHPDAQLVAVQSRERVKAEKIAHDFGAKHACTTVEELLALPELDAVIVASTPNVHYAQAKAALESGRHVLIEKPMTFTAAEARELVELAAQKNLQLVISCPWHFTRHGIEARRLIQSGALESSNVDMTKQLVDMIVAQRTFQANAQVITTNDQITQTILNIRNG